MIPVFFVNLVLAGALGSLIGGALGAGVGVGIAVLIGIVLTFAPGLLKALQSMLPSLPALPVQPARAPLVLPELPALLPAAVTARGCAFVRGIKPFVASFFTERMLPYTLGNIVLMLFGLFLILGVEVALYTALILVPLVLIAVMLMAVYSGPNGE